MISFERYVKTAINFVEGHGHEVLEIDDDKEEFINLIYKDKINGDLVFVHVSDNLDCKTNDAKHKFENTIVDYVTEHPDMDNTALRYSTIAIQYTGEGKAVLRQANIW